MDDDLNASWRRWLAAEDGQDEDEADAACGTIFQAVSQPGLVSEAFTKQTMQAIAAEAAKDARRAVRARRAAAVVAGIGIVGAAYFGAGIVLPVLTTSMVALFDMLIGAIVRTAAGVQAGADLWSLLGSLGHATSAFVADPKVTFVLLVLQGLALAALVTLQRLLGSDREF
jgi:hypothetical protein